MKKRVGLILGILILSSFLISSVSAAKGLVELTKSAIDGVVTLTKPYLETLLGETKGSEVFLGKILITIILISIVYISLSKAMATFFDNKKWALWLISIAVSLLGVRYLTSELIYTIIIPNSTFAVAVTAGLPFVLYFMIVKDWEWGFARRVAWIFFAVIFLGLYTLRVENLGDVAWIYPLTALLALAMAIWDKTIQRGLNNIKLSRAKEDQINAAREPHYNKLADIKRRHESDSTGYQGGVLTGYSGASNKKESGPAAYTKDLKAIYNTIEKIK